MPKRLLRKFLLGLVGAVVIALGITLFNTTKATTTFFYAVTELTSPDGYQGVAYDVNNSGQVVGSIGYAVLWNNGIITDLRKRAPQFTWASAINDVGQVVCNSVPLVGHVFGRCPYLWQSGNITYIGECGGSSYVNAINKAGQVTGSDVQQPFLWQNGSTTYLSNLSSSNSYGRALGINDRGQVVGYSTTRRGRQHGVLWHNSRIKDLGTLPSGSNSQALGINKAGKVVGWSDTNTGSQHAVLWQNRLISDLGTLDGNATTATAINNRGTVVGYSLTNTYGNQVPLHAFVWRNGVMTDLNSLLPANSGWELTTANAINEQGQIVGSGKKDGQTKAFLLTPVVTTN
jgi:probable HAF family extracellular repeat protein